MKSLSFKLLLLGLTACIAMSGFRPRIITTNTPVKQTKAKMATWYYWYSAPDDAYNDYNDYWDVADEEGEMETDYGVWVDENSAGGTFVENGYWNNEYPHGDIPSTTLYAHF